MVVSWDLFGKEGFINNLELQGIWGSVDGGVLCEYL